MSSGCTLAGLRSRLPSSEICFCTGEAGVVSLLLYCGAMAFFLSGDYLIRLDYRAAYDRTARWVLAGYVLLGWLPRRAVKIPRNDGRAVRLPRWRGGVERYRGVAGGAASVPSCAA